MTHADMLHSRPHNQQIWGVRTSDPVRLVGHLGAVQSQDYSGAKWALGLRLNGVSDSTIDEAFNNGDILRTHVMRPTWHFVTPEDIGWLLALTAPRVKVAMAHLNRSLSLDEAIFKKSNKAIAKALDGGKHLTRAELGDLLQRAGIATDDMRMTALAMRAELDGIICSGARKGKQFTYALLSERAPNAKALPRNESLAALATRYFTSHGPATAQDFAWWSGLTLTDAKTAIEMVRAAFRQVVVDGNTYWFSESTVITKKKNTGVYLLSNYDEYIVGYKDREHLTGHINKGANVPGNFLFSNTIMHDGIIIGTWKRTLKKEEVIVEIKLLSANKSINEKAIRTAVDNYAEFLRLKGVIVE